VGPVSGKLDAISNYYATTVASNMMSVTYHGATNSFVFHGPVGWDCGGTYDDGIPAVGQLYCWPPTGDCVDPEVNVESGVVGASGSTQCDDVAASCTTTYDPFNPYHSSCSDSKSGGNGPEAVCSANVPYTTKDVTVTCIVSFYQ
jgi:hypothetical protein